jgi:hypothetical protein
MLDKMHDWCAKWRLKVNETKSNIVYFRPSRFEQISYDFKYGHVNLKTVGEYKYLGVILDEHLNFENCSKVLSQSDACD